MKYPKVRMIARRGGVSVFNPELMRHEYWMPEGKKIITRVLTKKEIHLNNLGMREMAERLRKEVGRNKKLAIGAGILATGAGAYALLKKKCGKGQKWDKKRRICR